MWRAPARFACVAALLEMVPVLGPAAQPLSPAPLGRGDVTFVFHSTIVGTLTGRATVARAEFSGARLPDVRGSAVVLVAAMQTGNGARDRHMRETMAADSYPEIRFDLDSVRVAGGAGDSTSVVLVGRLTVHGVTRPMTATGAAVARRGGEDVDATFGLDMRDYGIRPPVRALVLHVAPDVAVTVHLSFGAGPAP